MNQWFKSQKIFVLSLLSVVFFSDSAARAGLFAPKDQVYDSLSSILGQHQLSGQEKSTGETCTVRTSTDGLNHGVLMISLYGEDQVTPEGETLSHFWGSFRVSKSNETRLWGFASVCSSSIQAETYGAPTWDFDDGQPSRIKVIINDGVIQSVGIDYHKIYGVYFTESKTCLIKP